MIKSYVLDTSAILTYTQAEEGSDSVEEILTAAKKRRAAVFLSFITYMELYYIVCQEKGEELAKEFMVLMSALPVERVDSYERLTLSAGRIKATHKLSVADSFVAATAIEKNAILVHKDPEFESVARYVALQDLPYKSVRR